MKVHMMLAVVAVAAALPAVAHGDALSDAKKAAADYRAATLKKDLASFEKNSTPDFAYIDGKGQKATKAQALAGMKGFYSMLTIKSMSVTAVSAKYTPAGLVYIQETKMVGSMKMGGPKPSAFVGNSTDEVTLVKKGGKWLTKLVKNLKTKDTIDGKPMPGM